MSTISLPDWIVASRLLVLVPESGILVLQHCNLLDLLWGSFLSNVKLPLLTKRGI
jgi:hypothetical protein